MPVISVLWGLGLLTAVALSLLWNGTMAYSLTHNDLESAEITAALEAGVNRAVAGLLDARPDQRWRADGVPQSFEFGGVYMKVSIEDELGKIDLNQADVALMVSLLQSAGLVLRSAGDLADKIADWRTATPQMFGSCWPSLTSPAHERPSSTRTGFSARRPFYCVRFSIVWPTASRSSPVS